MVKRKTARKTTVSRERGELAYYAGVAAETLTANHYQSLGNSVLHHRWRGVGGEIDLIVEEPNGYVFVEVKKAASFGEAACRLGADQMQRVCSAALEFVGNIVGRLDVNMRFDLALVNGHGEVEILENAFGSE
jgi:putative endonuclease